MSNKPYIYHIDDITAEESFGMQVKVLHKPGQFDNKVAVENVTLEGNKEFPQHHHIESDALILILKGCGYITDDEGNRYAIREGSIVYFPKTERHGFIAEEEPITYITVNSPPIKNPATGIEDFVI